MSGRKEWTWRKEGRKEVTFWVAGKTHTFLPFFHSFSPTLGAVEVEGSYSFFQSGFLRWGFPLILRGVRFPWVLNNSSSLLSQTVLISNSIFKTHVPSFTLFSIRTYLSQGTYIYVLPTLSIFLPRYVATHAETEPSAFMIMCLLLSAMKVCTWIPNLSSINHI